MDSKSEIAARMMSMVANRRIQAVAIAGVVIVVVAVLQVNNLRQSTPMCELLANANLANADLQRMQIALSQSGLGEYEVDDCRLMVPVANHSEYLQAIAEKNAIPEELRQSSEQRRPSVNPFLTRSQQLAIDRAEKKHQVRDMIGRLPFVDQAWFEMDESVAQSAFEKAEQSAVVSIRPPRNHSLSEQHVDTVKRMIGGAVAGLNCDQIVVIDLSAGYAYHQSPDASTSRHNQFQRIAAEQQHFYENQIREALQNYPGIKVSVNVKMQSTSADEQIATTSNPGLIRLPASPAAPTAGANTYASIATANEPQTTVAQDQVDRVSHSRTISSAEGLEKLIAVSIDVPQKLVDDLFGASPTALPSSDVRKSRPSDQGPESSARFKQFQEEIIQKIRPILPPTNLQAATSHPITVNLIRTPIPETDQWIAEAKGFAIQNWPSGAVLVIGLMLLSLVTRKPETIEVANHRAPSDPSGDIVSIHSNHSSNSTPDENPEAKLTKLLERDPDAAARVLEAWIRDAS